MQYFCFIIVVAPVFIFSFILMDVTVPNNDFRIWEKA